VLSRRHRSLSHQAQRGNDGQCGEWSVTCGRTRHSWSWDASTRWGRTITRIFFTGIGGGLRPRNFVGGFGSRTYRTWTLCDGASVVPVLATRKILFPTGRNMCTSGHLLWVTNAFCSRTGGLVHLRSPSAYGAPDRRTASAYGAPSGGTGTSLRKVRLLERLPVHRRRRDACEGRCGINGTPGSHMAKLAFEGG
jgi:hypothetical protein